MKKRLWGTLLAVSMLCLAGCSESTGNGSSATAPEDAGTATTATTGQEAAAAEDV